ncbi:hypothetical protein ACFQZC_34930 [Streptacidiphilus monticola]
MDGMDLPSKDAASVQRLFATQHQVLSTTSALSLAAVAVFGLTFVSAVQNGYERVWQLPAGPGGTPGAAPSAVPSGSPC